MSGVISIGTLCIGAVVLVIPVTTLVLVLWKRKAPDDADDRC